MVLFCLGFFVFQSMSVSERESHVFKRENYTGIVPKEKKLTLHRDTAPMHSSSVAFVISLHLLKLCYTMENLSAVTLCGYSFTFSFNYLILLYSCCL